MIILTWGRTLRMSRNNSTSSLAEVFCPVMIRSKGFSFTSDRTVLLSTALWMFQPPSRRTGVSMASTAGPDSTTSTAFFEAGPAAAGLLVAGVIGETSRLRIGRGQPRQVKPRSWRVEPIIVVAERSPTLSALADVWIETEAHGR